MATRETAIERYTFRCHHCGQEWARDYDVMHVTLPDDYTREYYSRNGLPVTAPGAPSSVSCPACGAEHPGVSFVAASAPQESTSPTPPPSGKAPAGTDPVRLARDAAHAIEGLVARAKTPGEAGFTQVGEVKEVVSALQDGMLRMPQLLDELGNLLDHVQSWPSPRHAGNGPEAARSLHRAADSTRELPESLRDELGHVRRSLATLESVPVGSGHKSQDSTT